MNCDVCGHEIEGQSSIIIRDEFVVLDCPLEACKSCVEKYSNLSTAEFTVLFTEAEYVSVIGEEIKKWK